jgi:ureidoacrylate peracid hydrolase
MPAAGKLHCRRLSSYLMHKVCFPGPTTIRVFTLRKQWRAFANIHASRTAHIAINFQNAFLAARQPLEVPTAREIVANVNRISKTLRAMGGLVVHVQNTKDAAEPKNCSNYWTSTGAVCERVTERFAKSNESHALWPGLDVSPRDLRIPKRHFSAFAPGSSSLHVVLQSHGIETLIITGTPTNICCESTARDAFALNYQVIFVSDATAAWDDDAHNAALGNMLVMSANVMGTNELLIFLEQGALLASTPASSH